MEKSIIEKLEEIKRNTKLRIEESEKNRQQIIDERNRQKQLEKEIKEKEYRRKETFLKIIKNEVIGKLQKTFIELCAYVYIINIFIILGMMIFTYFERFAKLDSTNHIFKGIILGIAVFIPPLNRIFSRINYTLFNSHSIFYSIIYTFIGLIIFSYVVLILFSIFFRIKKVSISKTKFWEKHEAQYGKYRQFIDFSNNEMAIITAYEKYLSQKIFSIFIVLQIFAVILFGVMGFFILYFPFIFSLVWVIIFRKNKLEKFLKKETENNYDEIEDYTFTLEDLEKFGYKIGNNIQRTIICKGIFNTNYPLQIFIPLVIFCIFWIITNIMFFLLGLSGIFGGILTAIGFMLFSLSEDYSFSFWDLYKGRFIFIEIDERRMKFLRKDNIFSSKKNLFLKSAIEELYYEEYRIKMKDGAILSRAYLFLKKEDDSSIELLDNLKIYEAIALTKHLNELVKK